jgi:hypothetical protein
MYYTTYTIRYKILPIPFPPRIVPHNILMVHECNREEGAPLGADGLTII